MSLSDFEIVEASTIEYQVELDRGLDVGEKKYPFLDVVKKIRPDQVIESPASDIVKITWSEPDIELKEDTGEVNFKSLPMKERSLEVKQYIDGIAETIRRLRMPVVRQHYADYIAKWAGEAGGIRWTQFRQAWDRLLNGDTLKYGACYDGQPQFDANHPGADENRNPKLYRNLFDAVLDVAGLELVVTEMMEYRNEFGLPFGNSWKSSSAMTPQTSREQVSPAIEPSFHLYVGPKLATQAAQLARMAVDNPSLFAGTFTWSVVSEITGSFADYWFIRFFDERRKPLNFIDSGSTLIGRNGYETEPGRLRGRAEWVLRAAWGYTYDRWDVMAMSRGN